VGNKGIYAHESIYKPV